jgi:hypothetical protein
VREEIFNEVDLGLDVRYMVQFLRDVLGCSCCRRDFDLYRKSQEFL